MKNLYVLFLICICYLPITVHSQINKDSILTQNILNKNKGLSIGIYGGGNSTIVRPFFTGGSKVVAGNGYEYSLLARCKLGAKMFIYSGVTYEMENYKFIYGESLSGYQFPAYSFRNYSLGIPLVLGYLFANKKWAFCVGVGTEFYYNYQNKATEYNDINNQTIQENNFFNGRGGSLPYPITSDKWSILGVFGLINASISYNILPNISLSCMSTFRFTDPFAAIPSVESFVPITSQRIISFAVGLSYKFSIPDIGGSFEQKEKR